MIITVLTEIFNDGLVSVRGELLKLEPTYVELKVESCINENEHDRGIRDIVLIPMNRICHMQKEMII